MSSSRIRPRHLDSNLFFDLEESTPVTKPEDYLCGLGGCRPKVLQSCASPKFLFVFFNLIGVIQGGYKAYTMGAMSTLEKRFSLSSKAVSLLLIGDNISPIFLGILIGYLANKISRPTLISVGMIVVGLSSMAASLPYFIYGVNRQSPEFSNVSTTTEYCPSTTFQDCQSSQDHRDDLINESYVSFSIIFAATFINGVGQSMFLVAGSSYLDDSAKRTHTPLYFGGTLALRALGPVIGFVTCALSLSFFEDPFGTPNMKKDDPSWIGCWWAGFVALGVSLCLASIPMLLFPKRMPTGRRCSYNFDKRRRSSSIASHKGTWTSSLKRVVRKRLFMLILCASVFLMLAIHGFAMFSAKYAEVAFRLSPSEASGYAGASAVSAFVLGCLIAGIFMHCFKPSPTFIATYSAVAVFLVMVGFLAVMQIRCQPLAMPGVTNTGKTGISLINECNSRCNCSTVHFSPICGTDGASMYFSPCFAGCALTGDNNNILLCECLANEKGAIESNSMSVLLQTESECSKETCHMFVPYLIAVFIICMIVSSSIVGNTLLMLRSISSREKNVALGFAAAILHLFAFTPYPIIYSAIVDSACTVWEHDSSCFNSASRGNCWLYDTDKFRRRFLSTTIFLLAFAFIFLCGVACNAGRIKNFYGELSRNSGRQRRNRGFVLDNNNVSRLETNASNETLNLALQISTPIFPKALNAHDYPCHLIRLN